jgi:hypothetical protein
MTLMHKHYNSKAAISNFFFDEANTEFRPASQCWSYQSSVGVYFFFARFVAVDLM